MTQVVAVYSMKGGVGKTTIAVNLAYSSAVLGGRRTLLWDVDAQGAASFLLCRKKRSSKARRVFSHEVQPADLIEPTDWPGLFKNTVAEVNSGAIPMARLDLASFIL